MLQAELLQNFGELLQNSPSQASTVCELPDVQTGFRKGRGTRDQISQHPLGHQKSKRVPEKHLFLLY